jgi:alpha-glucosidase
MSDGPLSFRNLFRILIIAWALCGSALAQQWTLGPLKEGKFDLTAGKDVIAVSFLRDDIVEFDYKPEGKSDPHSPVLAGFKGGVTSVQSSPGTPDGTTVFTTAGMSVAITVPNLKIKVSDAKGKELFQVTAIWPGGCAIQHDPYKFVGNVGDVLAGYQGTNGGPFFWTPNGYGFMWDSDTGAVRLGNAQGPSDDKLVIDRNGQSQFPRADFDLYVIVGSPRAILAGYADLSGHAPMFPKWNMGFMVTRWGFNEKEELETVDLFRQKKIPFDTYIVDYDSFNYAVSDTGDFEWNTTNFPDGPSGKLCKELLASKGVKMATIRKPRLSAPTPGPMTQEAITKGWIRPRGSNDPEGFRVFDYHIKEADDWWWAHEKPLFESGIAGYWNDEADGMTNFLFMEMARTEYEGQRSISNQRVWTLNRNFMTGSQRYAYALWSGDIGTGFQSMADQRSRMMDAIDGGELWWTMDTGGFNGNPEPENYARWIEFAAFAPIMRVHGEMPHKREPWNYGPQAEAVAKKYIELRYHLLPYLYSGAWQISANGLPLARPMWIDYSDDPNVNISMRDQWMLGDYLLVRPIVDQGATSAKVYLPKGTWIDYWTGKSHAGGQTIERQVDAKSWDDMPLYVKRGAIIPTAPPMQYVGEVPLDPLTIEVYPDAVTSSFTYYDDDGKTYDYEKDVYAEIPLSTQLAADKITFDIGAQKGSFALPSKTCVLKFHLLDDKHKADVVTANGQALTRVDSPAALDAKSEGWTEGSDASGPIVLVRTHMASGHVEVTLK